MYIYILSASNFKPSDKTAITGSDDLCHNCIYSYCSFAQPNLTDDMIIERDRKTKNEVL